MKDLSIPGEYKSRLSTAAKQHGFPSADAFALMLVQKGLKALGAPEAEPLRDQLNHVLDSHGYSSMEEVVEHLLERGLSVYETPDADPEKFKARLRGLGYID